MSRPSSSHNGTRSTITQNPNVPLQLVRLVPPPGFSPSMVPAKVQTELGPQRTTPTRLHTLHSTSPVSATSLREAPPRQLPPPHILQRRPPTVPQTQTQTQAAVSFLDSAFRSYADRIQAELTNLRAVCTRAIFKEQQDKEKWRRHCVTFKQERDVARERVRALIGERQAHMVRAGPCTSAEEECGLGSKRPRDEDAAPSEHIASRDSTPSSTTTVASSDPDDESNAYSLAYTSPTYLPLAIETTPPPRSPPLRSRSADAVLYSSSDSGANKKPCTTAFDVTLTEPPTGERRVQMEPAKKRRRKGSLSRASDSGSSSSTVTVVEDVTSGEAKVACRLGKGHGHLVVEEVGVHDITNKPKATPDPSAQVASPSHSSKSATPKIDLAHVDLMYVPTNGKLVCRACLLHCNKLPQSSRPSPTSFPTNAQWDLLRNHCTTQHPTECADVAQLHPAEVYELRRRLIMRS